MIILTPVNPKLTAINSGRGLTGWLAPFNEILLSIKKKKRLCWKNALYKVSLSSIQFSQLSSTRTRSLWTPNLTLKNDLLRDILYSLDGELWAWPRARSAIRLKVSSTCTCSKIQLLRRFGYHGIQVILWIVSIEFSHLSKENGDNFTKWRLPCDH